MAFVNLKGEPVDVSGMTPVAVTGKPVPPQAPLENDPNPYLRAMVPLTFQYQPDTLRQEPAKGFTQFRTPVLPASANAGVNAAAQNVTRNVENNSTTIAGLTWRGTWLSFANYSVNDVVVFNESTYVAIQASANTEPDTNTSVWSLVAENLVFNPVLPTAGFYGAFDQQAINSGLGTTATLGPITPAAVGEIALIVGGTSSGAVGTPSGWQVLDNSNGGAATMGAYVQIQATAAPLTFSTPLGSTLSWSLAMALFSSSVTGFTAHVTEVAVSSNVVTVTCDNDFVVGTIATCSGLSGITALNNVGLTILTATSTQYTAAFSHADYGPAADSGAATDVGIIQSVSATPGNTGTPSLSFAEPVTAGSTVVAMLCGLNAGGFGSGYSDVQSVSGDITPASWTIINSQASSGNKPHANIAFAQNVTGGSTVQLNVQDSVDGARYVIVELAGTFLTGFLPYDVVDFDGSKYVCITKTDNPPTVSPDDWYKLVDHTFTALTTGTNSQAAMVVGTGASLTYSGTGTVEANELLSTDLRTTGGSHKVLFQTTLGGAITVAQPNFADLAGTIALSQTPLTTLGDLLIVNGTPALARLAGNTTSTKNFLTQTGTGSVSAAPVWGTIATGDLPSGYPWNFLGNATGALTIANGTNATTFNQTSAATWTWANTTAATSGGNDSSPILNLSGTYWNGSASATDSWTIQDVLGSGTNPTSTLTLTHSGSSGTVNLGLGAAGISATNYSVSPGGTYQTGSGSGYQWLSRAAIKSPADGVVELLNNAQTGFTRLQFGGTTSSFPAIAVSGTKVVIELADASTNTELDALNFVATGAAATSSFAGNVTFSSTITDNVGSTGVSEYVLSSTHTGVEWVSSTTLPPAPDEIQVNSVEVNTCSVNVLVNGVGPVGVFEVNGTTVRQNAQAITEVFGQNPFGMPGTPIQGLRAGNTVYQNLTGYPILVMASFLPSSNNTAIFTGQVGSTPSLGTTVYQYPCCSNTGGNVTGVSFFVLPGQFYKIGISQTSGLDSWREFMLTNGTFTDSGDIHASRSLSVVFQNNSANTLFVIAQIQNVTPNTVVQSISDPFEFPTNVVDDALQGNSGTTTTTTFLVVPPGHYYKVVSSTGSILAWHEYSWSVGCQRSVNLAGSRLYGTATTFSNNTTITTGTWQYLNNSGKTRWVHSLSTNNSLAGSNNQMTMWDAVPTTWTIIQAGQSSTGKNRRLYGPVPPGFYYSLYEIGGGGTLVLNTWYEYTFE